ncbi:hypothetical protein HDU93_004532 [Gonapodya sp. JEL0774]|nr:hypothetical protein HDU93_004532 [Gonapodya sp. JEL0774]
MASEIKILSTTDASAQDPDDVSGVPELPEFVEWINKGIATITNKTEQEHRTMEQFQQLIEKKGRRSLHSLEVVEAERVQCSIYICPEGDIAQTGVAQRLKLEVRQAAGAQPRRMDLLDTRGFGEANKPVGNTNDEDNPIDSFVKAAKGKKIDVVLFLHKATSMGDVLLTKAIQDFGSACEKAANPKCTPLIGVMTHIDEINPGKNDKNLKALYSKVQPSNMEQTRMRNILDLEVVFEKHLSNDHRQITEMFVSGGNQIISVEALVTGWGFPVQDGALFANEFVDVKNLHKCQAIDGKFGNIMKPEAKGYCVPLKDNDFRYGFDKLMEKIYNLVADDAKYESARLSSLLQIKQEMADRIINVIAPMAVICAVVPVVGPLLVWSLCIIMVHQIASLAEQRISIWKCAKFILGYLAIETGISIVALVAAGAALFGFFIAETLALEIAALLGFGVITVSEFYFKIWLLGKYASWTFLDNLPGKEIAKRMEEEKKKSKEQREKDMAMFQNGEDLLPGTTASFAAA